MASQADVNEAIGIRKTPGDKDDPYAKEVIETATPEQLKIAREEVVVKKAAGGRVGKSYRGYGSARCN
jgi:hypothetical protein